MDAADALLEEYKTVRQESLEAVARHQTIVQYGLASTGVGLGLALAAAQRSITASALVLMGLVPLLIVFGIAMAGFEAERLVVARRHLRALERKINDEVSTTGQSGGAATRSITTLSWETSRPGSESHVAVNALPLAFFAGIGTAILIGPGIGGAILVQNDLRVSAALAVTVDLLLIGVVIVRSRTAYRRLLQLEFHNDAMRGETTSDTA